MAKAAFLSADLSRAATITGSATASGLGYDRLADPQPRHRARIAAGSGYFILDLGAVQSIDCAALISTSLDGAATARLRASASDATVVSSLVYDSGVQSNVTDPDWNGAIVAALTSPVTARYLRWDLTSGASVIDIGLAPCGLSFRPTRNFGYGAQEGRIDNSTRTTNPDTGAEFGVQLPVKRAKLITLPALTPGEVRGAVTDMDNLVGMAGDLLFIEDPADNWANRARDAIWGAFRTGAENFSTRANLNVFARQFRLVERL